ncbi:MAG: hypothetical protein ACRDJE_17805 [Dehalococcoidia bacterium]
MREERPVEITDADVRSFAAKLAGLRALLTTAEQRLLRAVLRRAAGHGGAAFGDVEGFAWRTTRDPFVELDAIDFGASARQESVDLLRRRLGELQ